MGVIESAVNYMISIANDNSHGYSQSNRWGTPDYDCSSLVISAWQQAGVPVKTKGATYTGNMLSVFKSCGFVDVTSSCNLSTGHGMKRGDVLLNVVNHTAMYIGDGKVVHARGSEGNSISGDQNGNEIRTQSYFNYPWNYVLRYNETTSNSVNTNTNIEGSKASTTVIKTQSTVLSRISVNIPQLKLGCVEEAVKSLQILLIGKGYSVGIDGADGDFGQNTLKAVKKFQSNNKLEVDGIVGKDTWSKLING